MSQRILLIEDDPDIAHLARLHLSGGGFDISRENVADCVRAALDTPASRGRVVDLLDGDVPIAQLFASP